MCILPKLFYVYRRFTSRKYSFVTAQTDLVIDAFPRSGNTFCYAFLTLTQKINLAHHIHLPIQFIRSIELGIPSILLIREPIDAIASMSLRKPFISRRLMFVYYYYFHKPLANILDSLLVVKFDEIIINPNLLIQKINSMFHMDLKEVVYTGEMENDVMDFIDKLDMRLNKLVEINYLTVARPSEERESMKNIVVSELSSQKYSVLYNKCCHIYNILTAKSN